MTKETRTTGIGSLPHPYVDAGLQFSFGMDIPFLPQFPMKGESMLWQVLSGLPGVGPTPEGTCRVDLGQWALGEERVRKELDEAFRSQDYSAFEPDPSLWSGWRPFLFEIEEHPVSQAKIQVAGPLTCQWALRGTDGEAVSHQVGMQVYRWILARALFMVDAVRQRSVQPIVFVDEPGLYGLSLQNAQHRAGLEELRLFLQTLRKQNALVGLHCCSNTDWESILGLSLDWVSFDVELSLASVLPHLEAFKERGGSLAFGLVPGDSANRSAQQLVDSLFETLGKDRPRIARLFQNSLITPACGLGLHTVEQAGAIGERLAQCATLVQQRLGEPVQR